MFGREEINMTSEVMPLKTMLLVGDSRVATLRDIPYDQNTFDPEFVDICGGNFRAILQKAEEKLQRRNYDVLVLFTLHCDFSVLDNYGTIKILRANKPAVEDILCEHLALIFEWQENYKNMVIVMTIPYVPDFNRYNIHRGVPTRLRFQYPGDHACRIFNDGINIFLNGWYGHTQVRAFCLSNLRKRKNQTEIVSKFPRPFEGETSDGIHPAYSTIEWFWKEMKKYVEKHETKKYEFKFPFALALFADPEDEAAAYPSPSPGCSKWSWIVCIINLVSQLWDLGCTR